MIHVLRWLRRPKLLGRRLPGVLVIVVLMNLLFGALFYLAERDAQSGLTLADGLWWAMVTMTTVGYGDYYAQTALGRFLLSYPAMIAGIGLVAYLAGFFWNRVPGEHDWRNTLATPRELTPSSGEELAEWVTGYVKRRQSELHWVRLR